MAKVVLGITTSLDGFINDRNGSVERLYPDLAHWRDSELGEESIRNTGAVVMGWNTFNMAEDPDSLADNYEYQVPIFVLTHHPPQRKPKETNELTLTFVTNGITSAIEQAKAAARDREVNVFGTASIAEQCLQAGLADELQIDIMPVFLGAGLRPFGDIGIEQLQLERIKVVEAPSGRTHLRFRIAK